MKKMAFVVFSSMDFYPITPGWLIYTIGSPVFSKISFQLPDNKKFYGPLETPFFTHEQFVNGGTLRLEMGPLPNKQWGVEKGYQLSTNGR